MNDNQNKIVQKLGTDNLDSEAQQELEAALGDQTLEQMMEQAIAPTSVPHHASEAEEDAAAAMNASKKEDRPPQSLQLRRGRIASIRGDDVFVNLHGTDQHLQGVVPLSQFDRSPRIGCIMDFVVDRVEESEGLIILSREGAASQAAWTQLARGSVVEARVVSKNKGGLELELLGNIKAFMPVSQIDLHHVDDLESFVGQKLSAQVTEIDQRGRRLVLSRRKHLERQRQILARKTWKTLEVGHIVEGRVVRLMPFGAFVDIGGVDGLLHVADMSYQRVNHPEDLVQIGQTVTVKILSMDPETKKISLGLKQAQPDPWDSVPGRIHVGDHLTGTVTRIMDFGAFIQIEPGLEALLPVSEMSWGRRAHAKDIVDEGQSLRVTVLAIDTEKRRMSVSLKQEQDDPWTGAQVKYPRNSLVRATVKSLTDFGAFAEIEPGVEGMVHISELSSQRVRSVQDVVQVGDEKEFRVLECDEENRKIRLSLKAVDHPLDQETAQTSAASKAKPRKSKFKGHLKGGIE